MRRARVLLTGASGQVGFEIWQSLQLRSEVLALGGPSLRPGPRPARALNLEDGAALRSLLREFKPELIINAAAYTAVDLAESKEPEVWKINAVAPGIIGEEAKSLGAAVIHFSSDYVYPGTGNLAYQEDAKPEPCNVYGRSKLAGDLALLQSGAAAVILRTSWVYSPHGHNFVKTMLRLGLQSRAIRVVSDQFGAPTSAATVAQVVGLFLEQGRQAQASVAENWLREKLPGIYHVSDRGETSWFEFAREIFRQACSYKQEFEPGSLSPIPTSEYPTAARRPQNSRLALAKLESTFRIQTPEWQTALGFALSSMCST